QRPGVLRERWRQELDGDDLTEFQIFGAIDLAHATAPGEGHDAVPFGDDLPGHKPATPDGVGTGEWQWRGRGRRRCNCPWSRRSLARKWGRHGAWRRDGLALAHARSQRGVVAQHRRRVVEVHGSAARRTEPPLG